MARRLIVITEIEDQNKIDILKARIKSILEEEAIDAKIEDFATGNITIVENCI
jgi:hypothetical protein